MNIETNYEMIILLSVITTVAQMLIISFVAVIIIAVKSSISFLSFLIYKFISGSKENEF